MSRKALLLRLHNEQIVGVVREDSAETAEAVADAYARNGIKFLEVTLTTPDALDLIAKLHERYSPHDIVIAAGTVRNANDAALARRAGAEVIVSPHTDVQVI
ncbi:MAG TPA: bifunctional 2-keto-4-hydroxyglutarate aldolase/2-keto-3-deoxy-6-phosphogluconate aldolase, partial [Thermoanaerobaculia bacterium]|nr:bifunctional 2-keto-4-hydroxyglutarate aldolase/2-keto-3-deoxy-6-phosphogluconate aldolase [Thermoanaerobaculia bacterium]